MATEPQTQALSEIIAWLEQQLRESREQQQRTQLELEQVQRQVHQLADQANTAERAAREIEPRLAPFKYLPDKLREIEEDSEQIRETLVTQRAELETTLRMLQAEGEYDRSERSEAYRRLEAAAAQIGLVTADVAQVQQQSAQVTQSVQTLLERQQEVEQRVEQFGLRLERVMEVNRDLEARIREEVQTEHDARIDVVFERMQVVGELARRIEERIEEVAAEQTLREEVLDQVAVWREEHSRTEGRLHGLEESLDGAVARLDKLQADIVLLEGRHSGLGERVGGIRKDIAEVVDHVRDEFTKYNQLLERSRRRQIQALEQELRETKFHAFRPPEEP